MASGARVGIKYTKKEPDLGSFLLEGINRVFQAARGKLHYLAHHR